MKRVVICGAGIVGLCCALYLRERGHEVIILDRDSELRDGCSFGNAGMIVPSHFVPLAAPGMVALGMKWMFDRRSPFYIRPRFDTDLFSWLLRFARAANAARVAQAAPVLRDLHLASRSLYEKLAERTSNHFELVKRGLLMLCRTQHALDEEAAAARHASTLGIPAEVVSPQRAAELDRGVRMDIAGAVFYSLDCHLTPQRLMQRLHDALISSGVIMLWSTAITGWRVEGDRIAAARTTRGELEADEFVLAGGIWSPQMVRGLGLRIPMQAGKGYSLTLTQPRQLPRLCSLLSEARVAVTPMGSALRFGGTMELSGLDSSIRSERVRTIAEAATRYFPEFRVEDFHGVQPWSGLRPCSPDGLPYIGRFSRYSNLCAATGHAMMGVSLAPITGQLVAEILSGERPRIAIEALSPDRYV